jgi:hypothetical protein
MPDEMAKILEGLGEPVLLPVVLISMNTALLVSCISLMLACNTTNRTQHN